MSKTDPITALKGLGLTGLEAETYVHLLMTSPCTGYSVAKGLRKPAARWIGKILNTVERTAHFPASGRIVPETERTDVREVLLGTALVSFTWSPRAESSFCPSSKATD